MRNSITFFLARLIPSLLGAATTALLTRLLPPAAYGLYALGLSIIFMVTIGAFEWLGLSLLRMAPTAERPDLFFGTVMTCFCALFGACVAGAALVLLAGGLESYTGLAIACLFAAFASSWVELKQRLQLAELRTSSYFRTSVGRGVVTMVLVSLAAYGYGSAPAIVAALGVSVLLAGLIIREPRLNFLHFRFDAGVGRKLFRFGFPLSVSVGLATILMSVDKWLLQALSGPHAVGLFSAATLVTQIPVLTLANCVGPSAYSMAVREVEFGSPQSARAQLGRGFVVLAGLVVPAAAGIVGLADNLAHVVIGPAYWAAAIRLAPWLVAAAVFASLRAFYVDIAFQLAHRTSPLVWTMLIGVGVNVAIDIWLIPRWGELGAAIGSSSALLVSLVVAAVASRRIYRLPVPMLEIGKVVASAAVMALMLRRISNYTGLWALVAQIGAGAAVYGMGLLALNVLGIRPWLVLRLAQTRDAI